MLLRSRFFAVSVLWLFLVALQPLAAQVDRGGIVGVILDPVGARVAGAQVTITNLAANQATKVTTDDSGNYAANLLRSRNVEARSPPFHVLMISLEKWHMLLTLQAYASKYQQYSP